MKIEKQLNRAPILIRSYPVAFLALCGVLVGGAALIFNAPTSRLVFMAVIVLAGVPLASSTIRNIIAGRFNVDLIASLAVIGAALQGEYVAGALVVLMQSGGEALEDFGLQRANRSLDNLLKRAPSVAHRRYGDKIDDVSASDLQVGDTVIIRAGDIIAADGLVIEGQGNVDEAALTGEPVPLGKLPGDKVYSGTINLSGSLVVRTTNRASESKYELIVKMVQDAQGEKAPIDRLANRFAPAFTILTLLISAGAYLLTHESVRALAVLVVATPCPLIIATPLAVLSAINRAAALNVIVKSGAALEQAGAVNTVVFDKTGTLTSGQPSLAEIRLFASASEAGLDEEKTLKAIACVEMLSSNVLARAVIQEARRRNLDIIAAAELREQP
ncbi:MAG: HAD-IC family P-type ATPase, partial [Chthonomonadales bacterium]